MRQIADAHLHVYTLDLKEGERLLNGIADAGVSDTCILALPRFGCWQNLISLYWKMRYTRMKVRVFGSVHLTDRYAAIAPEVQAKALLDMGCDGIKLLHTPPCRKFEGRGFDDEHYDKMFQMLEEQKTPVLIHAHASEGFYEKNKGLDYPSRKQLYQEMVNVLDRHPNLHAVMAHFFFLSTDPEEAERVMNAYPNVRFDLTPGVEMYLNFDQNLEYWREFFIRHSDRLIFGTDSTTKTSDEVNQELVRLVCRKLTESRESFTQPFMDREIVIRGLNLPEDVVQRICYQNFIDLVGAEMKPVNLDMYFACCERILHDLDTEPHDPYYEAGMQFNPDLAKDPQQIEVRNFCQMVLAEKHLF